MSRLRPVIAYLVFALVFGAGLSVVLARQARDRREGRAQVCMALVEARQTLADIIGFAVPSNASVRARDFLDSTQDRLSRPIEMCEQLDIDTGVRVRGATPVTTTTTTTGVPRSSSRSVPSAAPRGRRSAGSPTTTRASSPQGPRGGGFPSSSVVPSSSVPPTTNCLARVSRVTLVCR